LTDGSCGATVAGGRWRAFAWIGNSRRLVVRYERQLHVYSAFFHLACTMIVLGALLTWSGNRF
jgi:hypothetical protein